MIYSMTGFGKTSLEVVNETGFTVEISSVNRKQLEFRFNMPRELSALENDLRKLLVTGIGRGMINVKIIMEQRIANEFQNVTINQDLLKSLVLSAVELKNDPQFASCDIDLATFYNVAGVIVNSHVDLDSSEISNKIKEATLSALENFLASRFNEGAELIKDLANRIDYLKEVLNQIIPFAAEIKNNLSKKLYNKLADEEFKIDLNDDRLQKEILFYVDKSDVTEEITRLKSHFVQFDKLIEPTAITPGRSMDFLLQEMFREINTLGNKSGNCGVSHLVVSFKTELEKIREQCQNIE